MLFDLLTERESLDRTNVYNIGLLAKRLKLTTRWIQADPALPSLPIAYFVASTGAAAALWTAAKLDPQIAAVVSRGGRPDLALPMLASVSAPTLLLVGAYDYDMIELNKQAAKNLRHCDTIIIPGATHLFEEPGALKQICQCVGQWFLKYLRLRLHG